MIRCQFAGNSASYGGGAGGGTLNNCTLISNSASYGGGAAFCTLNNCTLTGNAAGSEGGGAYSCTLYNGIVYFNTASFGINHDNSAIFYSCTTPLPISGTDNITNDPQFVDRLAGNLRLTAASPCRNTGNNALTVGATDLDGNARTNQVTVDMGAYEFYGLELDYYYFNNPASGNPQNENVPGLGGTKFFEYSYDPLVPSYLYILAPPNRTTFLQTRFDFVNGGGEVYWEGFFYTNVVITNTAQFHGQPSSGAVTLEVWRTAFHPPSGWTNNSVYFAPQVHTAQGQFFMVTGLDGSDTNQLGITNNFIPPQRLYTGGPYSRDWSFAPTGAVGPAVQRSYLYHNNTSLNPQTEIIPTRTDAFLAPNYATTSTTFYVITDHPANTVPGQSLTVQIRIDYDNPEYGYNAQYHDFVFDQNLVLTSAPGFHGLPASGTHTVDLWRFDWPQPKSTNSPFAPFTNAFTVYYAPFIKTTVSALNPVQFQTDFTYLLGNSSLPANNYPINPQRYGDNPFGNDYSYLHQFVAGPDVDGDGIPDAWELQYFGSITNPAIANNDGDSHNNFEEYIADTIPTNAASFFPRIALTNPPPGTMSLVISSTSTGRVYGVYASTNLPQTPQAWTLVPPEKTGTASALTLTVTNVVPFRNLRTGVRLP